MYVVCGFGNKLANSTVFRGEIHAIWGKASRVFPNLASWCGTSGIFPPSAHRQWVSKPGGGGTAGTVVLGNSVGGCAGAGGMLTFRSEPSALCLAISVKV